MNSWLTCLIEFIGHSIKQTEKKETDWSWKWHNGEPGNNLRVLHWNKLYYEHFLFISFEAIKNKLTVLKICNAWIVVMCTVYFSDSNSGRRTKTYFIEEPATNLFTITNKSITDHNSQFNFNLNWIKNKKISEVQKLIDRDFNYY